MFCWKPQRSKDALSIYRVKVQAKMAQVLKAKGEPFSIRDEVDKSWSVLPPQEQLKYQREAADCHAKYQREKEANMPDCWAQLKRVKRGAAKSSPRRPAPSSAVVVDVDEELMEGDEELEKEVARRVSKMSQVEKRALLYFREGKVPGQRPDMRRVERDEFVLSAFERLSTEEKRDLLDKSEQHYARKNYKAAASAASAAAPPSRSPSAAAASAAPEVKKPLPAWTTPRAAVAAAAPSPAPASSPVSTPAPASARVSAPETVSPQPVVVIKPKKAVKREW